MNRRPYPAYKPSGVVWLGDVPEHWEICKLSRVTLSRCDGPFGSGLKSEHYSLEGVRVIRLQNIRFAQFDDRDRAFIEPEYYKELGDHDVFGDDLLIAGLGDDNNPVGRACVAPSDLGSAMVKADCFRFRLINNRASSAYIACQLSATAQALAGALATGTTRARMNVSSVAERSIVLPPIEEQHTIAAFLDAETAKIDSLVAKKRELIVRLKEKRAALISRTVTRGLPSGADAGGFGETALPADKCRARSPNVPPRLKPSGIPWLGDIPEDWEVCRLSRVTHSRCDGPFGSGLKSEHYCDEGIRVVRLQNIRFSEFDHRDKAFIDPEYYEELGDHSVIGGDLLVAGLGDDNNPVGRACVAPPDLGPAMVKADCFRFRLNGKRAHASYLAMQLSSTAAALAGALATGTTRARMNLSTIAERLVALPPLPEQRAIAAYLDRETAKIDALAAKVEEAVERLQEYRAALITAAVTGRIDVRRSVVSYPDPVSEAPC